MKTKLFGTCPGNKRNLSLIYIKVCELEPSAKPNMKVETGQICMIFNNSMEITFYSGMEIQYKANKVIVLINSKEFMGLRSELHNAQGDIYLLHSLVNSFDLLCQTQLKTCFHKVL